MYKIGIKKKYCSGIEFTVSVPVSVSEGFERNPALTVITLK